MNLALWEDEIHPRWFAGNQVPSYVSGRQERGHVERRLLLAIGAVATDRAGAARKAACGLAIGTILPPHMFGASNDAVLGSGERLDRVGGKTGTFGAAFTGAFQGLGPRLRQRFGKISAPR